MMSEHNSPPKKEHLFEGRLCAVGGQGIILGADIMAQAAIFHQGLYAIQSPTYGSQVRGGPTKVDVIIDTVDILYPKARNVKYFMAIAQSSFNKFWYDVADDAVVLLDSNLVTQVSDSITANRTFCRLPVVEMAKKEFKNVLLSNMICLGIIQDVSQVLTRENMIKAIKEKVPPKHLAKNLEAFDMGIALAQKELAGVNRKAMAV